MHSGAEDRKVHVRGSNPSRLIQSIQFRPNDTVTGHYDRLICRRQEHLYNRQWQGSNAVPISQGGLTPIAIAGKIYFIFALTSGMPVWRFAVLPLVS